MLKKAAILLSGCGSRKGSDPYETVFLALALEKAGFDIIFVSISSKKTMNDSANISKNRLYSIKEVSPKIIDVLAIPGGFGALWNFLNQSGKPKKEIFNFLKEIHSKQGIIIAVSLGVTILSRVFNEFDFGFDLFNIKPGNYLVNKDLKFIVSPGSMATSSIALLSKEIDLVVNECLNISKNE